MADNIFQQAIGAAPTVTRDVQAVQAAADPLIARFKSIAAAAAAASLTDPALTTDAARIEYADDACWHALRSVIGFAVDILRHSGADRLVRQYVASVIAADELAAGLAALSPAAAPPAAGPAARSVVWTDARPQDAAEPPADAGAPRSTEGVVVPPHEDAAPAREDAAPAREDAAPASAL